MTACLAAGKTGQLGTDGRLTAPARFLFSKRNRVLTENAFPHGRKRLLTKVKKA